MKRIFLGIICILFAITSAGAQQYIDERIIPPSIARDAEIAPTGESNAICVSNTGTVAPVIALCSTLALTGKTVLYKIPEYAFGSIPAGNPLVIVTNSSSAALCDGDGAIKAVCWHNGSSYVSLSGGAGSSAFADITGGTNTTAAMVVGTGASLAASGTGTIGATSLATAGWIPPLVTVATLPATPSDGQEVTVSDALTATDCEVPDGSFRNRCVWNSGTAHWELVAAATATPTLDAVMTAGNTTSHCTDSTPCRLGNGVVFVEIKCNDLNVCYSETSEPSDLYLRARTDKKIHIFDEANAADILLIDPVAGTTLGMYTFGTAYKPKKTISFDAASFSSDGTQCASPAEAALNTSKPKVWSITCTDNDAGRITSKITMPAAWDGLTIRIRPSWFSTSSDAGNIVQSWSGQCVRDGDPVADVATTGEQNATLTFQSEANEVQKAFTPAITLQGTCAGGATIFLTGDIDATGTTHGTMANARFLGAQLEYSIVSLSD